MGEIFGCQKIYFSYAASRAAAICLPICNLLNGLCFVHYRAMIGTTIARYKVTAKLGQGGMGEVYLATDTKLNREVAIKVLPQSVAQDKERLARFAREAQILAQLNHPNIAGVYGLEQSGDTQALILELVEGEDLSARLKRGPLPMDEALEVCKQIAEALEAAHEKGIIHRDLKPGNIKLTADGKIKTLDFGLAKSVISGLDDSESDSPTITDNYTLPGTLLGTAGYMSPEQAKGKSVDKRSDIWSFGVVMFECLTGKRLFAGENITDSIGALLHLEIDWQQLPSNTPPIIQLLLRKCLARDRKRRLHDIADARVDLEQAIIDPDSSFIRTVESAAGEFKTARGIILKSVLIVFVVAAALIAGWLLKPGHPLAPIRQLEVSLGADLELMVDYGRALRISPDGTTLAFIARKPGEQHLLYIRKLNQLQAEPVPGTAGLNQFCFSPDGQRIAFHRIESVSVVSIFGGSPREVCRFRNPRGLEWGENDDIIIGSQDGDGLQRVPSKGGEPEPVTSLSGQNITHRYPQFLPGGSAVIYTAHDEKNDFELAKIMLQPLPNGEPKPIWHGAYLARFLKTGKNSGHLVYISRGSLYALRFDLSSMKVFGEPVQVASEVVAQNSDGQSAVHFDLSPDGSLVYVQGFYQKRLYDFQWIDSLGNTEDLGLSPGDYGPWFHLSPDGNYLAYDRKDRGQSDIWVFDIERKIPLQLTFDPGKDVYPIWDPTGRYVAFSSDRKDATRSIYYARRDGGKERLLFESDYHLAPWDWHPEEPYLAISEARPGRGLGLNILTLDGNDEVGLKGLSMIELVIPEFVAFDASFSPDGKWLAYISGESDGEQVFVQKFPGPGGKKRISNLNGRSVGAPLWRSSESGLELVFNSSDGVSIQLFKIEASEKDGSFDYGKPVHWEGMDFKDISWGRNYDLHPDGKRALIRKLAGDREQQKFDHVVIFENFAEYLRQHAPIEEN